MHSVINKVAITCPFTPPTCPSCTETILGPIAGTNGRNLKNPDPHAVYGNSINSDSSIIPEGQQKSSNTPDVGNISANQISETSPQAQNQSTEFESTQKLDSVILIQKMLRGWNARLNYLIMLDEKKKAEERAKRIQAMSDSAAKEREERWAREEEESNRKRAREERAHLRSITTSYSELVEIFQRGTFGMIPIRLNSVCLIIHR